MLFGVPTPRANKIAWKESAGQKTKLKEKDTWNIASVSNILKNDFYIGILRQCKYSRRKINGADELLNTGDVAKLPGILTQRIAKHPEKVFAVNVVNESETVFIDTVL